MTMLLRIAKAGLGGLLLLFVALPAHAIDVERVVSPGGIEAWLVRDAKNPIIAMQFGIEGGTALDPEDKLGLAAMATSLLDEGAGELDSQAFQKRLEDSSIGLGFSAGREAVYGSLTTLTETKAEAFELLRLALTAPRFDQDAVERIRSQIIAGLRRSSSNPNYIAGLAFADTVFPEHPYGKPSRGTIETISNISIDDLKAFAKARLGRDQLKIGVSGDITAEELARVLDQVFGALPAKTAPFSIADVEPKGAGETVVVNRPIPQSIMIMGHKGVKRNDPDWFPALVLNYVLGGGGFSSRLMEEVREQRGLTYGVSTSLQPFDHSSLWVVSGSTSNEKAKEAAGLIQEIWARTAAQGITQEELDDAKTYLTGSYPLTFTNNGTIAGILLSVQEDDLGIDYLNKRNELVKAVTLEQVNALAKRRLDPGQLATIIVGQPDGVEPTKAAAGDRS